ncbi:MAG: hypothetical protein AB8U44_03555 [Aaplasma endosymbiont of Hyalomma asiaticum]
MRDDDSFVCRLIAVYITTDKDSLTQEKKTWVRQPIQRAKCKGECSSI